MYQVFFIILILDRLDWCCVFVFHILYFGIYTHVGVGTHTRACSCACTTRSQAPTTQPSLFRVVLAPSTFIPPISQAFIPSHWCLKPVCSLWLPESARWHCILPVHGRIQTSLMKRPGGLVQHLLDQVTVSSEVILADPYTESSIQPIRPFWLQKVLIPSLMFFFLFRILQLNCQVLFAFFIGIEFPMN